MAVHGLQGSLGEGEEAADASEDPWLEYFADILLIGKPEATHLYFARHAQAAHQVRGPHSEPSVGANVGLENDPRADPPLTPLGMQQAGLLARRLAQRGVEAVYCSPSRRARQTAEPLARLLGQEITVVEDLREVRLQSFDPGAAGGTAQRRQIAAALEADTRWDRFPGAEPSQPFRRRITAAVDRIVAAHPGRRVAIISHGGVVQGYVSITLGLATDMSFYPFNTGVTLVRALGSRRVLWRLNDISHLDCAEPTL